MIVLPGWMFDQIKESGRDMSNFTRGEGADKEPKDKIIAYVNRESRRAAVRARRRKG